MGRNAAFDHAGNMSIAGVAALIGWSFSQRAVFLLVPFFAGFAAWAVLSIPRSAINHRRARGADRRGAPEEEESIAGFSVLYRHPALLAFAGCSLLFQFANSPLLALVGQKLAFAHKEMATVLLSSCIIVAQATMLPISIVAGRLADRIGRKPLLAVGFSILPLRAMLYLVSDSTGWLIGLEVLDGIAAGLFIALTPLVIADLMRGTGRYNVAQGVVATVQGIGGAVSALAAGAMVDHFGYWAAFLMSACTGAAALAALLLTVPESREIEDDDDPVPQKTAVAQA
jgi:MFS family permease